MSSGDDEPTYHDEIELEDFEWDEDCEAWTYPCPCGDQFIITQEELEFGEEVATCPSCSLILKVIYDPQELPEPPKTEERKTDNNKNKVKVTA